MGKISNGQKIGILTAGGDCPGLNAAIRGVGKTAIVKYDMRVIGISDGYTGLINKEYRELTEKGPFRYTDSGRHNTGNLQGKAFQERWQKQKRFKEAGFDKRAL